MPAVLVHGVPDTQHLWDSVRAKLRRQDVVALSLPGFGAPLPAGFDATVRSYLDWLTREIGRFGEPVDLVGHDWGAVFALLVAGLRPGLVRTLACGGAAIDPEYRWHAVARAWRTPVVGEAFMALATPARLESGMIRHGIPAAAAREQARHFDRTMKRCILRLYRSARGSGTDWNAVIEHIDRPALVIWGEDDPFVEPRFGRRLAERLHADLHVFPHCGHWWPLQRPAETAAALEHFWTRSA